MLASVATTKPEASPAWITAEMSAVFARHPKEEVQRALPVLVIQMCGEFGFENLDEDFQREVTRITAKLGLGEGQSEAEMAAKMTAYVESLKLEPKLFQDLKAVYTAHHAALTEDAAERYQAGFEGAKKKQAPALGAARPEGAISAKSLTRALTGKIKT